MKRFVSALGAALLIGCMLSGCNVLPAQSTLPQTHDFGPLPTSDGGTAGPVRIDSVTAPAWIDDGAIHYRLVYSDPTSLRAYADHRWVAAPSDMLRLRLQSLLGGAAGTTAQPARLLTVELMEFEQDFSSAKQASVQLVAKLTLRKASDGQVLAEKQLVLSAPSTPDVQGAVTDLSKLAEQAAEQMAAWCNEIGR